jgi:hypothetical protein
MQGFEVKFNVYAETQAEADLASDAIKAFISGMAQKGIAVTANKMTDAVKKWKDNYFVTNYFR